MAHCIVSAGYTRVNPTHGLTSGTPRELHSPGVHVHRRAIVIVMSYDRDLAPLNNFPMIPDVVETLQQLIRIPSVNPMGRDVTGEQYCEHALTDYLEQFFQDLDVPVCRQHGGPAA